MKKKIVITNYGAGNLNSVLNAINHIGYDAEITNEYNVIDKAEAIIMPGVGAFGECMTSLHDLNIIEAINNKVLRDKIPFLGICKCLANLGFEKGEHDGLGWIKGKVVKINPKKNINVPHMGWNKIKINKTNFLFENIDPIV